MLIKVKDINLILIKFNKIGSEKCLECFCILLTDVRERMAKCTSEVCIPAVHVKEDGGWIYNYLYAISAYIITDVVIWNLNQGEVYIIMW